MKSATVYTISPGETMTLHKTVGLLILIITLIGCAQIDQVPTGTTAAVPPTGILVVPTETLIATPGVSPSISPTATFDPGQAGAIIAAGNKNFEAANFPGAVNDYSLAILANREYAEAYCRRGLA